MRYISHAVAWKDSRWCVETLALKRCNSSPIACLMHVNQ
jgi:hypothetical protein